MQEYYLMNSPDRFELQRDNGLSPLRPRCRMPELVSRDLRPAQFQGFKVAR